ncbi:MAG: ABC transporter substrate-binding protein [Spirochaetia bacterium]|nr:ABC transporter substrate-binding protein [Spirochaetia bacterium]
MKKRFPFALILILALLASCVRSDNNEYKRNKAAERLLKKEHRIKIAAAGPWESRYNLLKEGIDLALEEVNGAGGVLGAQIELIPFEDQNMLFTGGLTAYQLVSDPQICAVIGHSSSSISISNSLIYHFYGLLMFSPYSTNPLLTKQGLPYVFRNIPDDDATARKAAQFCEKMGWNKILVYYLNSSYGTGLANAFEIQSGNVLDRVSYETSYTKAAHTTVAQNWINNYEFDAIFLAGLWPNTADVVAAFREAGINVPIIDGGEFDDPAFFQTAGTRNEENIYTVSPYNENSEKPAYVAFKNAFRAKYGKEPDIAALQGYDALKVLTKAIGNAKSVKASDIAKALRAERWNEGAGPYRFDENGNITNYTLHVKKPQNRAFKVIE